MSSYYYNLCCRYHGRYVNIYDYNGRRYDGRIVAVDNEYVWLDGGYQRNQLTGFGYPWWFYPGSFIFPVALGIIGSLALASFFWW